MVHIEPSRDWPRLSARGRELFREIARIALDPRERLVEDLQEAALRGEGTRHIADDPVLAEGGRRTTRANILHWVTANVEHPGERVAVALGNEVLSNARDLVRRGLDNDALESYRTAQSAAWRRFVAICFDLTSDPEELRELIDVSAVSISTFIDDTIAAISERMELERNELTQGTHAERRAVLTLLLEGAPIDRGRAERQLNYQFAGQHTAAIVWSGPTVEVRDLEAVAEAVMRACGAERRLTIAASAGALWLWLPVAAPSAMGEVQAAIDNHADVRVAFGRTGTGMEGFRRSHLEALTTQRVLTTAVNGRRRAEFSEIELVSLLSQDPVGTEQFINDTLGALAGADRELRVLVLTYISEGCNAAQAATSLYSHRNTVLRRLALADTLLPRPLRTNVIHVGVALELLAWRGGS